MAGVVRNTIVVGGGLVGSAAACAIGSAHGGRGCGRLLVLDHAPNPIAAPTLDTYSNRVTALTPKSVNFLRSCGVWPKVEAQRAHRVGAMQVWDGASNGHIWLDADEAGVDSMATMVENDVLQHAFNQRMDELDSIEIIRGATVTDVSYRRRDETGDGFATLAESTHSSCAAVSLDSGDEVLGKLVVGSDGPRSVVKTKGGFGSMGWRYDQTALVATVRVSAAGPNDIAWQRFLPTGPVALLPLSPTVSSVVWSTTAERAAALVQLPPTEFVAELNDALNGEMSGRAGTQGDAASDEGDAVTAELQRLGGKLAQYIQTVSSTAMAGGATTRRDPPLAIGVDDGSRASFPLSFANANHYVRPRLALAGDAAHKVHPLAGQGLNLGLGDAEELAAIIADAHAVGLDPGDIHGLMRYERSRQSAALPVMLATDFFKRIFSTANPTVSAIRGLGVMATDRIAPIKSRIIRQAMGM